MNTNKPVVVAILVAIFGFIIFQFVTNFYERDYDAFCVSILMSFIITIAAISQFEAYILQKRALYISVPFYSIIFLLLLLNDGFETLNIIAIIVFTFLSVLLIIRVKSGKKLSSKKE